MKRCETVTLAEAIQDYLKEMNLEGKLNEVNIMDSWESVVGKAIAKHTTKLFIKEGVLYVYLNSSVVRNELMLLREPLRDRLNASVGVAIIKNIVLK